MFRTRWNWLVVSLVVFAAGEAGWGPALAERARPFSEVVDGSPIMTVLPKDAIPAIDNPRFVSATEADRVMQPEEPVLEFANLREAGGDLVMEDQQTGSTWRALTGTAIKGTLAGSRLRQLPATRAFWFAWNGFYPQTQLWRSSR